MKYHSPIRSLHAIILAALALPLATPPSITAQDNAAAAQPQKPSLTVSRYPSRFHSSQPFTPTSTLLLRFSQPVDPGEAGRHLSFFDKDKGLSTAAEVRRPSPDEIANSLPQRSTIQPGPVDSYVLIRPASPLAVGGNWYLRIRAGLSSESGGHLFHEEQLDYLAGLAPFSIREIRPENPYDTDMSILIEHSKDRLSPIFDENLLSQYISVEPQPENFGIRSESYAIRLTGDFAYDREYAVKVKPGIISHDRIQLNQLVENRVTFLRNRGFVSLPLFSETQSASGQREFEVKTANLTEVRTRIKELSGDHLIFALKGYDSAYQGWGEGRTIPYEIVPGRTIYDEAHQRTAEIDRTETFSLSWDKIRPDQPYGSYYICTEGPSATRQGTTLGAQAIVQVTDIGLAWKQTSGETLIHAFSLREGTPLPGLSLKLVDGESSLVARAKTDGSGTARFPADDYREKEGLWLDASLRQDRHVMPFSQNLDTVGLWGFGISQRYGEPARGERRTLIFTDRDVYRPGETVYLKSLSRPVDPDTLLPAQATKARLKIRDPRGRNLVDREIEFSDSGSFHDELNLPESGLGYHEIEIDFNDPDDPDNDDWRKISRHSFEVAEFRVNTFEVKLDADQPVEGNTVSIPLSARYYMGKPLSRAKASWNAYAQKMLPRPEGFDEFDFGDRFDERTSFAEKDTVELNRSGSARIEFDLPEDEASPMPRSVMVRAEVTDANQQTISGISRFTIHPSDFYIGLRKPEGVYRAGEQVPFALVAVDPEGRARTEPVRVALTIEKEVWNTVKVKGADGKATHRNERHLELDVHEQIEVANRIEPASGLVLAHTEMLTFDDAGDYVITLESADEKGRRILTREKFRVIGVDEPAWDRYDVVRIDLIPDREKYRVGDTAKLLIRSPIFGHALLTTERGDVKDTRTFAITEHETVIDLPIENGAAPNLFASVLITRGVEDSPHRYPAATYRIGYCSLSVEDPGAALEVTLEAGEPEYYQPGETVEVGALVRDGAGKPVAGAEVTLYAVDEGILSLTGYVTPDPGATFHAPFPLNVQTGQSLSDLFPEHPLEKDFGNKGYVIGGGGLSMLSMDPERIRREFKAVAFWKPLLVTDEEGRVTHRFTAPDNLTTFRLIAVVAEGNRFGHADRPVVTNKPIIVEPALPAFANLSDQIDITAVLHNNTKEARDLEVDVELDRHAVFLERIGEPVPTILRGDSDAGDRRRTRSLSLQPGQTEVLHFPVAMVSTGEATWTWSVRALGGAELRDATESTLEIGYPLPLLRSSRTHVIREAGEFDDLLGSVEPRLRNGRGSIEVELSNSRLLEAADAIDYLLTYPYGCVEQTTSATIPWLSTRAMREAIPDLAVSDERVEGAIRRGISRLLAMQTRDGGLSYWPGGRESVLWGSAYGGLALALAGENGIPVENSVVEALWKYLSDSLRKSADLTDAYLLSQRCLALYTLALAGKPEPAYYDVLFQKRSELPREARALLALAMLETGEEHLPRVETLLTEKPGDVASGVRWYRAPYLAATELMAWSRFRPGDASTDLALEELMKLRQPGRAWGATYSNAWSLLALSRHGDRVSSALADNRVSLSFGEENHEANFGAAVTGKEFRFSFDGDRREQPLRIELENDGTVYANVRVATQPELVPMQPENHGFTIRRTYQEVDVDGSVLPADDLMVGDLVLVTLDMNLPLGREEYLAIDDPLPSILEAVNPNFKSQATRRPNQPNDRADQTRRLYTNHHELQKERALFFADSVRGAGDYRIQYLARVVAAGNAIAPPAKLESMYEPERFGLSGTQSLTARLLDLGEDLAVR